MQELAFLIAILLGSSLSLDDTADAPSVEKLIEALGSNDFAERERALDALSHHRTAAEKHAAKQRELLASNDQATRQQSAMALAALGIAEPAVIDELLTGMGRRTIGVYLSQPERARSSMAALVKLGPKAVPKLTKALNDDNYAGSDLALEALGRIGPPAKEALPAIKKRLATDDTVAYCQLVEVKWRIDGDAKFVLDAVLPLLDQKSSLQGHAAASTLVHMGVDAKDAMPALLAALKRNKDQNVLWAVGKLAPHAKELALPVLREMLLEPALVDDVAITLQNLGEPAEKLIPLQLERLKSCKLNDGSVPKRIVYTIVIHGPATKDYIADLIAMLKHENPEVRRAAAWGIPRMFADDDTVVAALQEAIKDPETSDEAAKSLKLLQEARE